MSGASATRAAAAVLPATVLVVMLAYAPALASPFVEIKLAALVLGGALGAATWLGARVHGLAAARLDGRLVAAGAAVLLTTALSGAIAAARPGGGAPYAVVELVRWAATLGVALGTVVVVGSGGRARLVDAIQIAAALVALIGLAQHLGICPLAIPSISVPGSTFGNRNIGAEAIALALPFGLARLTAGGDDPDRAAGTVRGGVAGAGVLLQLAYLAAARTRGAWIGGALGVAMFLIARRPRLSRRTVAMAGMLGLAAVAIAALPGRPTGRDAQDVKRFAPATEVLREGLSVSSPVARTRLGLWRRAWSMARTAPLFGIGPGNFPVLFPRYAEPGAAEEGVLAPTRAPRRVHDDLLERLTETGAVGLLALLALYLAAAAAAGRALGSGDPSGFAAACAGAIAAFAGCGLTGFPVAMPGTMVMFGVALGGLAAHTADGPPVVRAGPAGRAAAAMVAVALMAGAIVWPARRLAASTFLGRAERTLRTGQEPAVGARALPDLARAGRAAPGDFDIALRTAAAASQAGRPIDALAAAQHALAIEPSSPNAWEALAQARLEAGDVAGADAAASRALELLHAYPGALYTRVIARRALGDLAAAEQARAALTALAATDLQARWLLARLVGR